MAQVWFWVLKTIIMTNKEQDPNLQASQEANTTKHINFLELEEGGTSDRTNSGDTSNDDSPTKKAWEEMREDKKKERDNNS
jgi:hypothetical protein